MRSVTEHGQVIPGTQAFLAAVADAAPQDRARLGRLIEWAQRLSDAGMGTLDIYLGKAQTTVLPRLKDEKL
jgi:hypothetical protein